MFFNQDDDFNNFFQQEQEKLEKEKKEQQMMQAQQDTARLSGFSQYIQPDYAQVHQRQASKSKKIVLSAILAIVMVAVFFMGMLVHEFTGKNKLLSDVEKIINNYAYIFDSDDEYAHDLYYQAAKAMLESIDPHSTLLTPEEYYDFIKGTAASDAQGISYTNQNKDYEIAEVQIGSPAYNAGVFAGDVVVGFQVWKNGQWQPKQNISYQTSVDDFIDIAFNPDVRLYVARDLSVEEYFDESKHLMFEVRSAQYEAKFVDYYFSASDTNMSQPYITRNFKGGNPAAANILDGTDVAYIRLSSFMPHDFSDENGIEGPYAEMKAAIQKFQNTAGKTKLIFDLRNNGGGSLQICANIATMFINNNAEPNSTDELLVSVVKNKYGNTAGVYTKAVENENYILYNDIFDTTYPQIVVLTNEGSASASEMLLAAMLDYGTCVQVGTTTYGKGIVQTTFDVGPYKTINGELWQYCAYMTQYEFLSPTGKSHHKIGLSPNTANVVSDYFAQMQRACAVLSA